MRAVKIGMSKDSKPFKRFDQFRTYSPFGSELVGFITTKDHNKLEKEIHSKFKDFRLSGEWFNLSDSQIDDILNKRFEFNVFKWIKLNGLIMNRKVYNSDVCHLINENSDNRTIIKQISLYCKTNNYNFQRGRDHQGRYFIITNRNE